MCLNKRFFRNVYDGREYVCKCGHCESCLQEKALKHMERLKKEFSLVDRSNKECLFVTLDYTNLTIPYIKLSEVKDFCKSKIECLPLYRGISVIDSFTQSDFSKYGKSFDFDIYDPEKEFFPFLHVGNRKSKVFLRDNISVYYKKDIQNFFKTLRIRLFRAGYRGYFSYFYSSEYGDEFKRSHTHFALIIDAKDQPLIEREIIASWKFSDLSSPRGYRVTRSFKRPRYPIEVAINPTEYISKYITKRSSLPAFLQGFSPFAPQSRFSNGFGTNFCYYTLSSVCDLFYRTHLKYPETKYSDGVFTTRMVKIPRYVVSKYWPKWKGYRNLSTDEIFDILAEPSRLGKYRQRCGLTDYKQYEDIVKMLYRRKERCLVELNGNISDYLYVGSRVWSLFASESIRDSFDTEVPVEPSWLFEHYLNIKHFYSGAIRNDYLLQFFDGVVGETDPNYFKENLEKDARLRSNFAETLRKFDLKNEYENSTSI